MCKTIALLVILALAVPAIGSALPAAAQSAPAADAQSVAVDGTAFVVTLSDGRIMRSPDLKGAVLSIDTGGAKLRLRIDEIELDPDAKGRALWLHSFSTAAADGAWQNPCSPGPDRRQQGFPLAFRPRPDGAMDPAPPGTFELVCTSGARGKCVRFGYPPWQDAAMLDLFNACVRMLRADYCGSGNATTRDGTLIDIYDDRGIQTIDDRSVREFEAGWGPRGAVCVHHVRVKENTSLGALLKSCPRLKNALATNCTEERARSLGASLFNRSLPEGGYHRQRMLRGHLTGSVD